ncbi:integral membrane protein with kinase activity [Streptomyces sp. HCCB10043]|nr:integral membrane protein with kinase activity [Streptomyces sp. HCCB10043]
MPENEITVPTPIVNPNEITQPVPAARPEGEGPSGSGSSAAGDDETAMLPRYTDQRSAGATGSAGTPGSRQARDADETAVLPPVRDDQPSDRVPQGFFRDESPAPSPAESENERTRELPQVEDPNAPAPDRRQRARKRPRPDWAEETPLDDLPTLADELLGGQDDDGHGGRGRRPRG